MILAITNVILGVIGFCIAFYIFHKKSHETALVCPIGSDCDSVVHSEYSEFFGVPVERLGMLYYLLITIFYALAIFFPTLTDGLIHFIMLGVTLGSFLFSAYLVSVQGFVLHEWCAWCLGSAAVSTMIFLANFFLVDLSITSYLVEYKGIIVLLHGIAAAIGVGGATITDTLFFKYLSDKKISKDEGSTLKTLSTVIWFALGLLVLTGVGLYLPEQEALLQTPKFLVKMIVVAVLILNGVALNLVISPKITKIKFDDQEPIRDVKNDLLRHVAFALGAVSIISWYFVFILGSLRKVNMDFDSIILIYLLILVVGILGSQFFAEHIRRCKSYEK